MITSGANCWSRARYSGRRLRSPWITTTSDPESAGRAWRLRIAILCPPRVNSWTRGTPMKPLPPITRIRIRAPISPVSGFTLVLPACGHGNQCNQQNNTQLPHNSYLIQTSAARSQQTLPPRSIGSYSGSAWRRVVLSVLPVLPRLVLLSEVATCHIYQC